MTTPKADGAAPVGLEPTLCEVCERPRACAGGCWDGGSGPSCFKIGYERLRGQLAAVTAERDTAKAAWHQFLDENPSSPLAKLRAAEAEVASLRTALDFARAEPGVAQAKEEGAMTDRVHMWSTDRGISERRLIELRDNAFEESTPAIDADEGRVLAAELIEVRQLIAPIEPLGAGGRATPGPWIAYRNDDTWHVRSITADCGVASVSPCEPGKTHPNDRADALLCAAAPELLAACELALPHHQGGHSAIGAALRAAISKATGLALGPTPAAQEHPNE